MFFILIAALILAAIAALFFAAKIKLCLTVRQNRLTVRVSILGVPFVRAGFVVRRKRGEIAALYKTGKKGEKPLGSVTDLICRMRQKKKKRTKKKPGNPQKALAYIRDKIYFYIRAEIKYGTGDAFATAMAGGIFRAVLGALFAVLKNKRTKAKIKLSPAFSKIAFSIELDCIIKLSPANIMIGYMIYKKILRR